MIFEALAAIAVAIWLYLLFARGWFWLCSERDGPRFASVTSWPAVTAVVPARDEAACIGESIASLLRQNYRGRWAVVLVDDDSNDGTADIARRAAQAQGGAERLQIVASRALPGGWTGKLWAVKQGVDAALAVDDPPDYVLLTDADVIYEPQVLASLVAHAQSKGLALASFMVKLRCESFAERSLVPAFIFFFQMLYPFGWVNRTERGTAAAAGGCMLVRADRLRQAGGIDSIRSALIDDCALAQRLKAQGPIWLGLTERVHSIRQYPGIEDIRRMVARSAYAQLRYSPLLLAGTIGGMTLVYLAPPLLAIFAGGLVQWLGLAAWLLMAIAFQPTLRLYRRSPLWGLALPAISLCYMLFTIDSALQFARGKGGLWKGRIQASRP
ncbi:MAG: glycosyltransferase [Xanthobacteraceae bacterium]